MNLRALVLLVLALACALPAPSVRARCGGSTATVAAEAGTESCCGTECRCTPQDCPCSEPEREPAPSDPTVPPAPREPLSLPMPRAGALQVSVVPPAAPPALARAASPRAPPVAVHVRHCVWRT